MFSERISYRNRITVLRFEFGMSFRGAVSGRAESEATYLGADSEPRNGWTNG